jgi:hypothetical protein
MRKPDLNPFVVKWGLFFILLIATFFFIMSMFLSGCNAEKRAVRKQDKAYGITVSTPRTFAQAGANWLAIHPCITPIIKDSIIFHTDTLVAEKKVFIPIKTIQFKEKILDTIIDNISIYADSLGITVKNLQEAITNTKTIIQTKVDQTRVNNLTDSLNSEKRTSATKDGIIQTISENNSGLKKSNTNLWWLVVAISVAGVLSHVIRSYATGWFSSVKGLFKKS